VHGPSEARTHQRTSGGLQKVSEENELFMKNKEKNELTFVIGDPKDVQEGRPQRQAVVPDQMGQHLALVRMHHPVKEHSCKNK
jgi:hypothetical protein